MRLLLTSFLSIGVTVKAQLRGGGIPASPPRLVASSVNHQHENHRDLMEGMMSGFMPLGELFLLHLGARVREMIYEACSVEICLFVMFMCHRVEL